MRLARRAVWIGVSAGALCSIGFAVVVHAAFQHLFTGARREVVEGVVGLVAAGLLVWVAWWLHRQAAVLAWTGFLRERVQRLARGQSRVALAGLAFLAVAREGIETALFVLGMAPAISMQDLGIGLGIGLGVVVVAGVMVLVVGVRVPVGPMLRMLSLLLAWLALKFTGAGIQALQVAEVIPPQLLTWWPDVPQLGLFPSALAVLAQSCVLLVLVTLAWCSRCSRPIHAASAQ